MPGCYTCVLVATWVFPLLFGVLQGALVLCHWGQFGVCVEVIVSGHDLVGMIYPFVGPPSEVAQEMLLELLMGYSTSEVVSLVEGRPC